MEMSEKIELVSILNELVKTGELDISSSRPEKLHPGKNIRTIYVEGGIITIYLSEKFIERIK